MAETPEEAIRRAVFPKRPQRPGGPLPRDDPERRLKTRGLMTD